MIVFVIMAHTVNFIASFLLMLITGIYFGPWFALTRSLSVFEPAEFIKIARTLSKNLGPSMRFLLPGCILMMIVAACLYQPASSFFLSLTSISLIIVSLIITVVVEVPIVKSVEQWTAATLPANWQAKRNRWVKFHIYRVLAGLTAFALWIAIFI